MLYQPGGDVTAATGGRNGDDLGTGYIEAAGEFLVYLRETIEREGAAFLCVLGVERRLPSPLLARPVFRLTFAKPPDAEGGAERLAARLAQAWEDLACGRYHPLTAADVQKGGAGSWTDSIAAREGRPREEQLAAFLQRVRYVVAEELAGRPLPRQAVEPAAEEALHETWAAMEEGRPLPLTPADVARAAAEWRYREEQCHARWQAAARIADMAAAVEGALRQRAAAGRSEGAEGGS